MAVKTEKKPVKSSEQTEQAEQTEQTEQTDDSSGSGDDDESDSNNSEGNKSGTMVSGEGVVLNRKVVVFLGPHNRYSRKDIACFDSEYAEELVERGIAVWPDDAEKALAPRPGDDKFETDIG